MRKFQVRVIREDVAIVEAEAHVGVGAIEEAAIAVVEGSGTNLVAHLDEGFTSIHSVTPVED